MNALISQSSSKMLQKNLLQKAVRSQAMRSMTMISKESAEEYKKLNYSKRMEKTGRPISPHFTIWAWDIYGISSGFNRATGCLLMVGCTGLGGIELLAGSGSALSFMQWVGAQPFPIAAAAKFSVSFPLVYHYLGGLRHFRWDIFPETLTTEDCIKSAYIMFPTTVAISGAMMFM